MTNQTGLITCQPYSLKYSAISDTGLVRAHNEDLFLIIEEDTIFCVADGAGGQGKGDLASYLTIKGINEVVKGTENKSFDDTIPVGDDTIALPTSAIQKPLNIESQDNTVLIPAIHHSNELCRNSDVANLASTIVCYHFKEENLHIVHVGDSRAYCYLDNNLQRLTRDHSLVNYLFEKGEITEEEKQNHPKRNVILRAVGAEEHIKITHDIVNVKHGTLYLLCSDGLTSMLSDKDISSIITDNKNDIDQLCTSLVQCAKDNGGRDNITIIIIKVE